MFSTCLLAADILCSERYWPNCSLNYIIINIIDVININNVVNISIIDWETFLFVALFFSCHLK